MAIWWQVVIKYTVFKASLRGRIKLSIIYWSMVTRCPSSGPDSTSTELNVTKNYLPVLGAVWILWSPELHHERHALLSGAIFLPPLPSKINKWNQMQMKVMFREWLNYASLHHNHDNMNRDIRGVTFKAPDWSVTTSSIFILIVEDHSNIPSAWYTMSCVISIWSKIEHW